MFVQFLAAVIGVSPIFFFQSELSNLEATPGWQTFAPIAGLSLLLAGCFYRERQPIPP